MPHNLLHTFRVCIATMIMGLSLSGVSAQSLYQIYGPQVIQDICERYDYGIVLDPDTELVHTDWLFSTGEVLAGSNYNVTIQFPSAGTYILYAISTSLNGEILQDSIWIQVYGQSFTPEIIGCYEQNLNEGCYRVCAGSITTIVPPTNANFEVDGAESYQYVNGNLEVTWGDGGDGYIVVSYPGDCELGLCFQILPEPYADFKTIPPSLNDTLTVCKGQEILFENLSVNGQSYSWGFGDGNESVSFNATHTYKEPGLYTVMLNAESICECDDRKQMVVEVLPTPAPTLDCVNSICPESRQRYTASSNGCNIFFWTVSGNGTVVNGGGIADDFIEIIWHDGPEGIIELSVDDCLDVYCPMTNSFRIPVITPDVHIVGNDTVCLGTIETYEVPYFPGTQYHWQVGGFGTIINGENTNVISVKWQDSYANWTTSVSVQYDNCFLECGGESILPIKISPGFKLTGDSEICQGGEASIQALQINFAGVDVQWHIVDDQGQIIFTQPGLSDNFTHTFSYPPGDYEWMATNTSPSYCYSELRKKIRITAPPTPPDSIIGNRLICPGQTYGFTIDGSGQYATVWTITDGASVFNYQGQTCEHTFGVVPPYIVAAHHTDIQYPECVSDPISITLETAADHLIQGPAIVCLNDIDSFSFAHISGATYDWQIIPDDHGEIKRSELNNVEVYWTQPGIVTLRLNACGFVFDQVVNVQALPSFNIIGPLSACAGEIVTITTDNPTLSHEWSNQSNDVIGSSNTISLSAGNYSVALTDATGCSNERLIEISSLPIPSINISTAFPTIYCGSIPPGVEVVSNTDGVDYVYTWYKDGVSIGTGGPKLTITDFGTYSAEVTNQYGCKSISESLSDKITFLNCCIPADCIFSPPCFLLGCAYIPQDFDIVASGVDCRSRTYTPMWPDIIPDQSRWSIESASLGSIAIIMADTLYYDYTYPGYYVITMTGLINGHTYLPGICGGFQQLIDTIRAIPHFTYKGLCAGESIAFEDLTTFLPDEYIASWSWNFDDPTSGTANTSSLQDPTHIFTSGGDYNVRMTAMLASGCSVTKYVTVHIAEGPVLSPEYDPVYCEHEALAFHLPGELFEIAWDFGDVSSGVENIGAGDSLFHTYDSPGIYTAFVSARDVFGCKSQEMFNVDIRTNALTGDITMDPGPQICNGDTAILTSPAGGVSWLWNTSELTEEIRVTETSQYYVLIRDQYQCTYAPPSVFLSVKPKPEVIIKAREIFGQDEYGPWENTLHLCYGTEFEIQVFTEDEDVVYQWESGVANMGLVFTAEGANLPLPGDYNFELLAWLNSCSSDSTFIEIEIYPLPSVPLVSLSGSGCSHNANTLQVTNPEAGIEYQWSDGQKGVSITTESPGTYYVIAENLNGCINKSASLTIKPAAQVDQIPGGCHLKCDPLTVCLPPINNVTSWNIFQNGNPYQSGTAWPDDFILTDDGSYTIEVATANGCVATSDPLDIALYTGVGSVTVLTYLDVDHDGLITSADAILPGMPVVIISDDGLHQGSSTTLSGGEFVFKDYPATTYTAHFNPDLLSSEWKIIIDSMKAQILTCDDSVVVSLLLDMNCFVAGPDLYFENCPGAEFILGDSIWTDTGEYVMHVESATGCDSVYNVHVTWPDSLEVGTTVWVDVDQNGIVSPADTVISGITIVVDAGINQLPFIDITDANGYVNGNYPSRFYFISIDSTLLPPGYSIVYGSDIILDTVCGTAEYDFLLVANCSDVFIIQQAEMCEGDSVLIEGQWIIDAGVYSYVLTDGTTGCDSILDVYVTSTLNPVIQSAVDWNCIALGSIALTVEGTGPYQYEWSTSLLTDSLATGLEDGTYIVRVSDLNGCLTSDTIVVVGSDPLSFDVPGLYEIHAGDSVEIFISGDIGILGLNFDWSAIDILSCPACPSTLAYPLTDTTITIQITDADSCVYLLETKIIVREDSAIFDQIYAPNVFSPNGDNINDRFTFFSRLPDVYVYELTIMDRWGEMVFHINDIELDAFEGWDGTLRDKTMNPGVFTYFAKVKLSDGQEVRLVGDVTLLR